MATLVDVLGARVALDRLKVLEYAGAVLSVVPTVFLALFPQGTQPWMWLSWMAGAAAMVAWAVQRGAYGVLGMQMTYFALNVVGLIRLLHG